MMKSVDRAIREALFQPLINATGVDPARTAWTCETVSHLLAVTAIVVFGMRAIGESSPIVLVPLALFGATVPVHQASIGLQAYMMRRGHRQDDAAACVSRLSLFASTGINTMLYVVRTGLLDAPMAKFAIAAAAVAMPTGLGAVYFLTCTRRHG